MASSIHKSDGEADEHGGESKSEVLAALPVGKNQRAYVRAAVLSLLDLRDHIKVVLLKLQAHSDV